MQNPSHFVLALTLLGATAASNVGCAAHGEATGSAEVEAPVAFSEPPTLVEVDSDVWVVSDYDYPVYYVGDTYWVYRDDVWYRSRFYDGGWARADVAVVPIVIVHRDPRAYVHYHASATARTRVAARERGAADVARPEAQRAEPQRAEPQRGEPQRGEPPRAEPPRAEAPTHDQTAERTTERRPEERGATPAPAAPAQRPAAGTGHGGARPGKKRGR